MPFFEVLNLLRLAKSQDIRGYLFENIGVEKKKVGKVEREIIVLKNPDIHKFPAEEDLSSLFTTKISQTHLDNGFLENFKRDKLVNDKNYTCYVRYP